MSAEPARARRSPAACRVCPRCAGDILAILRVPYGWRTGHGIEVGGTAEILLCSRCDVDDPVTGPVATFFAVHAIATEQTMDVLARLIRRWVESARPPRLDHSALDAEVEAWYRGDL